MHVKKALPETGFCTLAEAADYAGVHIDTVRRWIRKRKLRASRPFKRGSSRVRVDIPSLRKMLGG